MVKIFGHNFSKDNFIYDTFHEYDDKMTKLATEIALMLLKTGTSVIIDDGFWYRKQRDEIRQILNDMEVEAKFYYVDTPVNIMKARTVKRSEDPSVDSLHITEQEFNNYLNMFEPPADDEEFTLIEE